MARSHRLRLRDIRGVSSLIGQIGELGADPTGWRTHALHGFVRLTGGQSGLTADLEGALPGSCPRPIDPLEVGWVGSAERQAFYDYSQGQVVEDPGARALLARHSKVKFSTFTREQEIDDRTWYDSPSVSELRRFGRVDDFLSSTVSWQPGWLHGFIVYRPWGGRRFDSRERRLMRLGHLWLFRLYREGLDAHIGPEASGEARALPRRARQTLNLLLAGYGMKQVAAELGISVHTVNDYVKTLHRHFGVATRAELLTKLIPRRGRPKLALPPGLPPPAFGLDHRVKGV